MSPGLILLGSFFLMVVLGVPISFALGISSALCAWSLHLPLMIVAQRMASAIESFPLLAIPFFVLAGEIMVTGKIARRLVDVANVIVGRFTGGMGMVNVLASTFFGGISGSTVADVASLGPVEIAAMTEQGYDKGFATALTVVTAIQAVIIPPSHNMVLYSLASGGTSIGKLFLGGYVPGAIISIALMTAVYAFARARRYPRGRGVPLRTALLIFRDGLAALFTAVIIIGGLLLGVFTATEASAFAAIYAFVITFFLYRDLPLKEAPGVILRAAKTIGLVLTLIATASAFGWMMAYLQIPAKVTTALLAVSQNKALLLLIINLGLLFLGMIMDMAPIILTVTPILMPVMNKIGVHPVHFGVIMMINLGIGLCTPPVGNALFTASVVSKLPIERFLRDMYLLLVPAVVVLLLVTYVPALTMWLPNLLMK